jgi:hypothetical protein
MGESKRGRLFFLTTFPWKSGQILHRAEPEFSCDSLDPLPQKLPTIEPFRANGASSMSSQNGIAKAKTVCLLWLFPNIGIGPANGPQFAGR